MNKIKYINLKPVSVSIILLCTKYVYEIKPTCVGTKHIIFTKLHANEAYA